MLFVGGPLYYLGWARNFFMNLRGVTALKRPVSGENSSGNLEILPGFGRPKKLYGKNAVREVQILRGLNILQ